MKLLTSTITFTENVHYFNELEILFNVFILQLAYQGYIMNTCKYHYSLQKIWTDPIDYL